MDAIYVITACYALAVSGKIFGSLETLPEGAVVTHTNMNDQTVEGMYFKDLDIYSVQFHPEACPGPTDTAHIFDEFITVMQGGKLNA